MFDLGAAIRRLMDQALHRERGFFRQYVGDDTVLIGGPDQLFLYIDGRDASLTPCLLRDALWEPEIDRWMARNLPKGGCFVDIGANIGIHALHAARHMGEKGLVAAFEPQERLFNLCRRSIAANGLEAQVQARRLAIGEQPGHAQLGKFAYLAGSATFTPTSMVVEHEDVEVATLPAALERIGQEVGRPCVPDAIKIDVEGFEIEVWMGMRDWTRQRERLAIVMEYSPVSYRDAGRDPLALLEDISAHGFDIAALLHEGETRLLDRAEWAVMAASRQQYDLVLTKGWPARAP